MTTEDAQTFTTRDLPWARVGTVIDGDVDAAEAARLGGLDFTVELRRAGFAGTEDNHWYGVGSRRVTVRADTNEFYDYVSTGYKLVQYRDAFTFMDGINPRYVAAGTLNGGKQGFVVVQLPEHATLDPTPLGESDPYQLYVILRTSHDRSKAIEVAVMPLRHKCMNQLGLPSLVADAPQRWSIRHVGDPHKKLEQARDTLRRATRYVEVFDGMTRQLASVSVSNELLRQTLQRVLPNRARRDDQIIAIERAFTFSPVVGFTGTGYGAVNAVSEYFEHGRGEGTRTPQSRFTSGLEGDTRKYVNRTAQLLLNRA